MMGSIGGWRKKPPSTRWVGKLMGVSIISQAGEPYVHRTQLFYCVNPMPTKKPPLTSDGLWGLGEDG